MFTVFAVLFLVGGPSMASPLPGPLPHWIVGCWLHAAEGEQMVQRWTADGAARLFGASWTVRRDSLVRLDIARMSADADSITLDLIPTFPSGDPRSLRGPGVLRSATGGASLAASDGRMHVEFRLAGSDVMRVLEAHGGGGNLEPSDRVFRRVGCGEVLRPDSAESPAMHRLHEADARAVVAGDADALERLWTDDIVALAPGIPPRVGRAANAAAMRRGLEQSKAMITEGYRLIVDDVHVVGSHAIEWGRYEGRVRPRADAPMITIGGPMLRVIRREPDGDWRVTRTMFGMR